MQLTIETKMPRNNAALHVDLAPTRGYDANSLKRHSSQVRQLAGQIATGNGAQSADFAFRQESLIARQDFIDHPHELGTMEFRRRFQVPTVRCNIMIVMIEIVIVVAAVAEMMQSRR